MFTHAAHARGEYEEAVRLAEEAIFLARRHDTGTRLMYAIGDLGALAISVGGYAHAEAALLEALALGHQLGAPKSVAPGWYCRTKSGGGYYRGWWRCPDGCTAPA